MSIKYKDLIRHDVIPDGAKTYNEWQQEGCHVIRGAKSKYRHPKTGLALFTPAQVKPISAYYSGACFGDDDPEGYEDAPFGQAFGII